METIIVNTRLLYHYHFSKMFPISRKHDVTSPCFEVVLLHNMVGWVASTMSLHHFVGEGRNDVALEDIVHYSVLC